MKKMNVIMFFLVLSAFCATADEPNGTVDDFFCTGLYEGGGIQTIFFKLARYEIPDADDDECYNGADWCISTSTGRKVAHWHLDTSYRSDLTSEEKANMNRLYEYMNSWATSQNRIGYPSIAYNCHAYAWGRNDILILGTPYGGDGMERLFADDCEHINSQQLCETGDLFKHTPNPGIDHTSIIDAGTLNGVTVIDKFRGKMGFYGIYRLDRDTVFDDALGSDNGGIFRKE